MQTDPPVNNNTGAIEAFASGYVTLRVRGSPAGSRDQSQTGFRHEPRGVSRAARRGWRRSATA